MSRTKVIIVQDDELENYPPCQGQSQRRDECMLNNGHRGLHTSQDGRYWL
jgi:hypothetical protein